jgi:hypothetical protein
MLATIRVQGLRVSGFGLWVAGLGGLGFGVWGLGVRFRGFGVWGLGVSRCGERDVADLWGLGLGFGVWGLGFRVPGSQIISEGDKHEDWDVDQDFDSIH